MRSEELGVRSEELQRICRVRRLTRVSDVPYRGIDLLRVWLAYNGSVSGCRKRHPLHRIYLLLM